MQPLFQGPWAPLGEALVCTLGGPPPAGALRIDELLGDWPPQGSRRPESAPAGSTPTASNPLDECLRRHALYLDVTGSDRRAVASHWCLAYLDVLLPPIVAAASVLQHAFPVQPEAMAVQLDDAGVPTAFHIADEGHAQPGTDTATRYAGLIDAHLARLFSALARQARVAPKILWGNLARRLDNIFDQMLALTGPLPHIVHDREHLLHTPQWAQGRANPMHYPQRTVIHLRAGVEEPLTLHRQCCLCYLLPGDDYCGACPLAPQFQPPRRGSSVNAATSSS